MKKLAESQQSIASLKNMNFAYPMSHFQLLAVGFSILYNILLLVMVSYTSQFKHKNNIKKLQLGCPPVRGDNPRALASELSYVQVDKHGITILYMYHQHQCRPCTSRVISR